VTLVGDHVVEIAAGRGLKCDESDLLRVDRGPVLSENVSALFMRCGSACVIVNCGVEFGSGKSQVTCWQCGEHRIAKRGQ
jgi:hypothetical protein